MTRKTTPKKPSQLDRIETKLGAMDAFVSTTLPAMFNEFRTMESKLDLLLKGSDFMKEIGEKEVPWVPKAGDLVISASDTMFPLDVGIVMRVDRINMDLEWAYMVGIDQPWHIRNVRPATPAEVQKYEEQVKAQEQEAKKAKLVWGTKVMYGNSEGIFLDHDDNDNTCWVALKPTGNCDWLSISDLTIIDP